MLADAAYRAPSSVATTMEPVHTANVWGSPQTLNYVANERTPGEPMEFWYPKGSKWFAGVLAYANGGCRLRFLNTQRLGTQPTHFAAFKWAQFGTMIRSLDVDVRDVDALRWPGLVDGSVYSLLLDIWADRQAPLWAYGGVLPTHASQCLHWVRLPRHAWMLGSAAAEAALTFDSKDVVTSVDVKWEKLAPALLANVLQTFTAAWGAPTEVLGQSVRTYTYAGAAQRRIEVNVIGTGATAEHDLRIFIAAVPAVAQSGQ